MHVALFQPQIPPNTGNIIRLCANTNTVLHLIHPLGFVWDDKRLRRAGMDYSEFAKVKHYKNWQTFYEAMHTRQIWALTTKTKRGLYGASFASDDVLLFGSETAGLSTEVYTDIKAGNCLRLPMVAQSRSLNLSNAVAAVLFEALRQQLDSYEQILL